MSIVALISVVVMITTATSAYEVFQGSCLCSSVLQMPFPPYIDFFTVNCPTLQSCDSCTLDSCQQTCLEASWCTGFDFLENSCTFHGSYIYPQQDTTTGAIASTYGQEGQCYAKRDSCEANTFSESGTSPCRPCLAGGTSPVGSNICLCVEGYIFNVRDGCVPCNTSDRIKVNNSWCECASGLRIQETCVPKPPPQLTCKYDPLGYHVQCGCAADQYLANSTVCNLLTTYDSTACLAVECDKCEIAACSDQSYCACGVGFLWDGVQCLQCDPKYQKCDQECCFNCSVCPDGFQVVVGSNQTSAIVCTDPGPVANHSTTTLLLIVIGVFLSGCFMFIAYRRCSFAAIPDVPSDSSPLLA